MKAISLWQPWATAIALGSKTIETRHWPTSYRGPLAIHAAKRSVAWELDEIATNRTWLAALYPIYKKIGVGFMFYHILREHLPLGAIVATCNLIDCRPTDSFGDKIWEDRRPPAGILGSWCEADMGNFEPGRFGWVLDNIQALPTPLPFRGRQGLFDVPDELLEAAFLEVAKS